MLHTQRGLAWKAKAMTRAHGLVPADAVLVPAPMAHISGLLNGVLLPAATGMTSVLMARWDPEQAVDLIEAERISFMAGPPTFFVSLVGAGGFRTDRVGTLRLVSSGGAPVTPAFVAATSEALGCRVKRTYGSSEAPMVTTSYPGDDRRQAGDTDGRAVGEVELRVVDPADGRRRPPGSTGELWLRGPELFVGYADPEQTAASHVRGGWFRTGDLATVDEEGWLQVVGRLKDVIIRGGENISVSRGGGDAGGPPGGPPGGGRRLPRSGHGRAGGGGSGGAGLVRPRRLPPVVRHPGPGPLQGPRTPDPSGLAPDAALGEGGSSGGPGPRR